MVVLLVSVQSGMAQVTGPSPVDVNTTHTYEYADGFKHLNREWVVVGGTVTSEWYTKNPTTYKVSVLWGTGTSGTVTFKSNGIVKGTKSVVINPSNPIPPPTLVDENYVYTLTPRIAVTDVSTITNDDDKIEAVTYFDGLGRSIQNVGIRAGGNKEDIVAHIEYDEFGRQNKDYLPYPDTTIVGLYRRTDALSATNTHYLGAKYTADIDSGSPNPYSEKAFEASPLNRVLKQAAPGEDWKLNGGHEIEFDYDSNSNTEVRRYEVTLNFANNTYTPTLILDTDTGNNNGYYTASELYKTVTKDENHDGTSTKNHTVEEFKDKQGRVVLKRTYANISSTPTAHDTYYVYDDYGNLTYVLPPKVEAHATLPSATILYELCYQYMYDHRNRLVEKKIPGKGGPNNRWEEIVYNKLDQPILTRDPNFRDQAKWLFTKYDAFGRVAYTGIMSSGNSRVNFQTSVDATSTQYETKTTSYTTIDGTEVYYDNAAYPTSNISEILTINYYDNYTFDKVAGSSETSYGITPITNAKGLATGSKVRVLDTDDWITTVSYYDDKSRPIYVYSFNDYLSTTDKVKSEFDFVNLTETTTTHAKTGHNPITTVDAFTYDHTARLKTQTQTIGSNTELIAENTYDELGQLESKNVGNTETTPLQTIDYTYNVRGWLKQINDPNAGLGTDLFAFQIHYNDPVQSFGTDLFNGNISETSWKTANDNAQFRYTYFYDDLNRITKADFAGGGYWARYKLQEVKYDKNGNITLLRRRGHVVANPVRGTSSDFGDMDNLIYDYGTSNGNQLYKVRDNQNDTYGFKDSAVDDQDYWYDANGNMTKDDNKGITNITYNHLNLPEIVSLGSDNITYIYDATGLKLKKIVSTGGTTEYAGNYIYKDNVLQYFNHPEGYVEPDGSGSGGYDYVYQYKDHLGNIRLSYKDVNGNYQEVLDSDFENNNYDGWVHNGNVTSSFDNGKLKINVDAAWEGIKHDLGNFAVSPGETYTVKLTFDKGNTVSKVRLYFQELDANGNHLSWNTLNSDLLTGNYEYSYTVNTANRLRLRIDKLNTNLTSLTYFYVDHVSLTRGALQIQEENNYYPFGLKHKGYNGNIVSEDKYHTFQGQELEEELGKNTYAFQWRDYDPAIGRFNKIDRFAEKYVDNSPYAFTMNNPMRFREVKGDSLWINYDGNRILYENGNLKNRDGSDYTGSGVTVAADGSISLSGFLKEAVGALNSIRNGGDSGNELVSGTTE